MPGALYNTKSISRTLQFAQPGVIGFYSSTDSQQSNEAEKWQNGVFTRALLDGLAGEARDGQGQHHHARTGTLHQNDRRQRNRRHPNAHRREQRRRFHPFLRITADRLPQERCLRSSPIRNDRSFRNPPTGTGRKPPPLRRLLPGGADTPYKQGKKNTQPSAGEASCPPFPPQEQHIRTNYQPFTLFAPFLSDFRRFCVSL